MSVEAGFTDEPVPAYVILYAVRYGLGRQTYAHADALQLIRNYWPLLRQWKDSVVGDLHLTLARMGDNNLERKRELKAVLDWINDREGVPRRPRTATGGPHPMVVEIDEAADFRPS